MDSESFLEFLSPGFNDFDLAWGPSDGAAAACAMQAPAAAWLPDVFINAEGFMSEDTEEEAEEADCDGSLIVTSSSSKLSGSAGNGTILSDASETYSSVLKLSDIAWALNNNFSKAARLPNDSSPLRKPSPEQSALSGAVSSRNACATPMDISQMQPRSDTVTPTSYAKAVDADNAHASVSPLVPEIDAIKAKSNESRGDYEKESSSKLTSSWDASDNECDEEDGGDFTYSEDSKPCVSHVRVIRRPNSNCGQALAPSPKRLKVDLVKTEATSSCETVSLPDDKDSASDLSRMRKEGMSQREVHILSERQRRKSMRESFFILQALVPKLKPKHTDRITVLTEVITYIQSLRCTLEDLERKKADMMELLGLTNNATYEGRRAQADVQGTVTYVNTNDDGSSDEKDGGRVATVEVTVRICGSDVFVTVSTPQCRGVWSGVLLLLQKYSIEVSNATLATTGDSSFHCIHAKATNLACIEGVDLQDKLEGTIIKELRRPARKLRS